MMLKDELLHYLFDGQPHPLAQTMAGWFDSSRRFTDFVNNNHTKIRKKIRTSQDSERLRDLQLELETAYLLLRERALSVQYETQHPREGRSPDFEVMFTSSISFMVEVTRMRTHQQENRSEAEEQAVFPFEERFIDMLCSKLGQLLAQRGNILVVGTETMELNQDELYGILRHLQKRAEGNDSSILQRHGFRDRADFFRYYQRLSAILLRGTPLQNDEPVLFWENPQAKYPLPSKVRTALLRSHTL
jgi:hypothetical protein